MRPEGQPTTTDAVVDLIDDGADLIVPLANGEPVSVLDAIEAHAERFQGVRVHQMHALHDRPYLHGTMREHLAHVSYFLSPVTRPAFHSRGCDLVPNHFSDVPRLLHENPAVELLPVDYVNDPRIIALDACFVSINATTEVDLVGQCASETVAGRYWSSSGGQADFARGAMYSERGIAFVVLRSTAHTPGGEVSRIRATLTPGSMVTTLKNTVDHIVTEFGVADMRGRSIAQRARALIAIAHPTFREELAVQARRFGYI